MRAIVLALAAFALASAVSAATPAGPYKLDTKGKCHAANGQFAAQGLCKTGPGGPYKLDAKGKCHAANGQFVTASLCKH